MIQRIAAHVHSEWSYDASWPLKKLAEALERRGYHAVLMSEHDRGFDEAKWREYQAACQEASSERLLIVPGIEYSDASNDVHVLVWGAPEFLGESLPTLNLLQQARDVNAAAVLAHPTRRGAWKMFTPQWGSLLSGIELWNRKTDGWAPSRQARTLLDRVDVPAFAGLDFHTARQLFPLAMRPQEPLQRDMAVLVEAIRRQQLQACIGNLPLTAMGGMRASAARTAEVMRRTAARALRLMRGKAPRGAL